MLSFLAPYKLLAIAIAIAGIIYGIYTLLAHERTIGYQLAVSEYTTKQLLAETDARSKEAQLNKQLIEAQNAAVIRDQQNKKLSDALAVGTRKLRDTTTTVRSELSGASCDANRNTADAALTVFDECAGEYTEMAKNAEGHANDVQTLEQGWPSLNAAH